uniref:Uncharacterized protein n=1 Tax=Plectus sambesii TaxID=2011161 RepID=A0A914WF98_9BILA
MSLVALEQHDAWINVAYASAPGRTPLDPRRPRRKAVLNEASRALSLSLSLWRSRIPLPANTDSNEIEQSLIATGPPPGPTVKTSVVEEREPKAARGKRPRLVSRRGRRLFDSGPPPPPPTSPFAVGGAGSGRQIASRIVVGDDD